MRGAALFHTTSGEPVPRLTPVLLSLVIAVLVYFALVAGIDGDQTLHAMYSLDGTGWAIIFGLSLLNYLLRFLRWHGYMRWLGHRLPLPRHALIYLSGFGLTTTPGKAGEGVRAIYLARRGIPYAHTVAALFAERLLDLLSIILLSLLAIASFTDYAVWLAVPLAVIVALITLMHRRALLKAAQNRLAEPRTWMARALAVLVHAWERAFVLLSWRPLLGGLLLGCLSWGSEGLGVYVIAGRLGLAVPLLLAIGVYATGMLIGALSFVPGGLGSTEAAMTLLLKLSGIAGGAALSVTLIARIATLWFAVALGLCCLAGLELEYRLRPAAESY